MIRKPALIKTFIRKTEENKLLPFLFFLLVSCCLWLLQALNYKYETDVAFKINVKGLPSDVELDKDDIYFMARLRDYGTGLIGYELWGATPVDVNYAELGNSNGRLVLPLSVAKQKVENLVGSSTSLVRMLQDTIMIDVKRDVALLPVKIDGIVDVADHYTVADIEIIPSEVNVYATAAHLEKMSDIRTEYVVKKYLKNSIGFKAKIVADELVTVEPSVVDVYVTVHPLVEKKLRLPVEYVGFPVSYPGSLPREVEVTFEIPEPDAGDVGEKDFSVSVDYAEAAAASSRKADIVVTPLSHKISNVSTSPSYVILQ